MPQQGQIVTGNVHLDSNSTLYSICYKCLQVLYRNPGPDPPPPNCRLETGRRVLKLVGGEPGPSVLGLLLQFWGIQEPFQQWERSGWWYWWQRKKAFTTTHMVCVRVHSEQISVLGCWASETRLQLPLLVEGNCVCQSTEAAHTAELPVVDCNTAEHHDPTWSQLERDPTHLYPSRTLQASLILH